MRGSLPNFLRLGTQQKVDLEAFGIGISEKQPHLKNFENPSTLVYEGNENPRPKWVIKNQRSNSLNLSLKIGL